MGDFLPPRKVGRLLLPFLFSLFLRYLLNFYSTSDRKLVIVSVAFIIYFTFSVFETQTLLLSRDPKETGLLVVHDYFRRETPRSET